MLTRHMIHTVFPTIFSYLGIGTTKLYILIQASMVPGHLAVFLNYNLVSVYEQTYRDDPNNYHPISLTFVLVRILHNYSRTVITLIIALVFIAINMVFTINQKVLMSC